MYVMIVSPAKTAEAIEMPFELWTQVGPMNHVLDESAHWRLTLTLSLTYA